MSSLGNVSYSSWQWFSHSYWTVASPTSTCAAIVIYPCQSDNVLYKELGFSSSVRDKSGMLNLGRGILDLLAQMLMRSSLIVSMNSGCLWLTLVGHQIGSCSSMSTKIMAVSLAWLHCSSLRLFSSFDLLVNSFGGHMRLGKVNHRLRRYDRWVDLITCGCKYHCSQIKGGVGIADLTCFRAMFVSAKFTAFDSAEKIMESSSTAIYSYSKPLSYCEAHPPRRRSVIYLDYSSSSSLQIPY